MKEIPNTITSKDLLYLEDMMNWNLIMNKKINTFIECIDDEEIIIILEKAKKMHKKHFKELLSILD